MLVQVGLLLLFFFALTALAFAESKKAIGLSLPASLGIRLAFPLGKIRIASDTELCWQANLLPGGCSALHIVLKGKERYTTQVMEFPNNYNSYEKNVRRKRREKKYIFEEREFYSETVANPNFQQDMTSGKIRFVFPKGVAHSLASPHFMVLWALDVIATDSQGKKLLATFDLDVFPEEK